MNKRKIAIEAAKQIRGRIVDITGVSLDYRDDWMEAIIKAAIEEDRGEMFNTVDCQRREIERLRKLINDRAVQTEVLYCDLCGNALLRESCNHVRPCAKCCPPAQASEEN